MRMRMAGLRGLEYMNDDPGYVHILYMSLARDRDKARLQAWGTRLLLGFPPRNTHSNLPARRLG